MNMNIKSEVTSALQQLSIFESEDGYFYICEAVFMVIEHPELVYEPLNKGLYPLLAKKFQVTENTVATTLQKVIDFAWKNGDDDALLSYFGYTADDCDVPSTDVFIAAIADSIKLNY